MKNIYIDKHDEPYVRLFRGILQQAIVDFDMICDYKKRGLKTFKDHGKVKSVEKEYNDILQYFDDIKDFDIIDVDINDIIIMIKEKNGL